MVVYGSIDSSAQTFTLVLRYIWERVGRPKFVFRCLENWAAYVRLLTWWWGRRQIILRRL